MKFLYAIFKSKFYYFKLRFTVFFDFVLYVRKCRKKVPLIKASDACWQKHREQWKRLNFWVNRNWLDWYTSLSGVENPDYVPEDIYHAIIEPILNDFSVGMTYSDKNQYDRFWGKGVFLGRLYSNMHGVALDGDYGEAKKPLSDYLTGNKVLVKPALESGDGRGLNMFFLTPAGNYQDKSGNILDQAHLNRHYGENYLIQKAVDQHPFYAAFNPTSLNTVRVFTYRSVKTEEVVVLVSALRVGKAGSLVDSMSAGGFVFEIMPGAILSPYGVDDFGNKVRTVGEAPIHKVGPLYRYDDMLSAVLGVARQMPYFRLLGFDVCVDKDDKVWLVEVNTRFLGTSLHQSHGRSLFGPYTGEVIEHCARSLKKGLIVYSAT